MSRIADKHGLTNKYRSTDIGKRVVKRGRPRTHLVSGRKKAYTNYSVSPKESNAIAIVIAIIAGVILCCFVPFFIPIVLGATLIGFGDIILKKWWNLPTGKWSAPASIGWTIITAIEMIVSFFMSLLVTIGEMNWLPLFISVIVYVGLSALVLIRRYKRLIRKRNKNIENQG